MPQAGGESVSSGAELGSRWSPVTELRPNKIDRLNSGSLKRRYDTSCGVQLRTWAG